MIECEESSQFPQSHKDLLDERRRRVDSGESALLEWDKVKHTIGKRSSPHSPPPVHQVFLHVCGTDRMNTAGQGRIVRLHGDGNTGEA